jgi:hypothetical protein
MRGKNRCRKMSKLLQTMPKGGCEETLRIVSDHLTECEECRRLHADLEEMDKVLNESEAWFEKVARETCISRSRIITQLSPSARRRAWRLRAVWVGAAAILLVIAGSAVLLRSDRGGLAPLTVHPPGTRMPTVTRAMAAASSSRTLLGVAEVLLRRREAPSLELPPAPRSLARESFTPPFLRQCAIESDARLGGIVQSRIDLSTASAASPQPFRPQSLQQGTLESHDTLGRILRSRINLTRREDT